MGSYFTVRELGARKMVEIALGNNQATQLKIPSASVVNAEEEKDSSSALDNNEEARHQKLLRYLTKRSCKSNGSISTYKASKSTGSENRYFRYTYREEGKQRSKSIPGGNIRSPLAQKRAQLIKQMIIENKSILEIVYFIGSFSRKSELN